MAGSELPILDSCGLRCPLPVLKAQKFSRSLKNGARFILLADDPMAIVDVPHFCSENGHLLLESERQNKGIFRFLIKKNAAM